MSLISFLVISQKHVSFEVCQLWHAMSLYRVRNAPGRIHTMAQVKKVCV